MDIYLRRKYYLNEYRILTGIKYSESVSSKGSKYSPQNNHLNISIVSDDKNTLLYSILTSAQVSNYLAGNICQ